MASNEKKPECKRGVLIGEGNSGRIFKMDNKIVKKVFKNKKFFEAELNILEKIKGSKYIVKIHKIDKQNNTLFMEYVPYNLECIINGKYNKKLYQFNKNKIAIELLLGLKSLHNSNIVHNDFKAKNIQVTDNNTIKIIDFDSSDFNLKTSNKKIEDINKAKIIILQLINKRSFNHTFKNRFNYIDNIKEGKFKDVMTLNRNNLTELINYLNKNNF